ncbi:hypothetical protein [Streptomyces prunicolor]|uniref:ABC transporter permease n=1 Tax=Streptomyces prunicolor TaxID=67348 RepID=A0ABU4F543_9ACTN|nr:hypothetical protein [Streptomyces prunicolor]MDV7215220.1 hypothetical protein [Streptomyces prunicolor]
MTLLMSTLMRDRDIQKVTSNPFIVASTIGLAVIFCYTYFGFGALLNRSKDGQWEFISELLTSQNPRDRIRSDYQRSILLDPAGYEERLRVADAELDSAEAASGIEELTAMLGGASLPPTLDSGSSQHAMNYAGMSVLEVFRLLGPPPPGIRGPRDDGEGGVPGPGAGVPSGGRRG